MTWRPVLSVLLILAAPAWADLPTAGGLPGGQRCRPAILAAERTHNIPDHLLAAIARVESGRRDPVSGSIDPWPWTINAEGQGAYFDTKAEAIAAVQALRAKGVRSIDVGCMQISLLHHPDAFASLEQAFDPASNANYGARFLSELYGKSNNWPRAVEMYHSATPGLGEEYGRLVYAALPTEQRLAGTAAQLQALSTAWAATLNRSSVTAAFPPSPARIIPLGGGFAASPAGGGMMGRTLDSYRAAPVRLAFRPP
ncbi:MAG: lytic transglycosylase domain-containing protein [Acetobacteraceae bacterium]